MSYREMLARMAQSEGRADRDTEAIVAAAIDPADQGDTTTDRGDTSGSRGRPDAVGCAPTTAAPAELIADKGYHSRAVLKDLTVARGRRASPSPSRGMPSAGG